MLAHEAAVFLDNSSSFVLPPKWKWLRNFNLWICFHGHGTLRDDSTAYLIEPGACFLFQEGQQYSGESRIGDAPRIAGVGFHCLGAHGKPTSAPERPFHRTLTDPGFALTLRQRMILAVRQEGNPDEARFWLRALLLEIDRQDRAAAVAEADRRQADAIDLISAEILEDPARAYSINELAGRLCVSPHHFRRLFKRRKGATPRDFIIQSRIESAKILLRRSDFSITDVACSLGYSDIYYFSRQFKTKVGESPSRYRKRALSASR